MVEFVTKIQSRGNNRLTIEIRREVKDDFKAGDKVTVTIKKIKKKN